MKHYRSVLATRKYQVAPCAGAWIETVEIGAGWGDPGRRPLRGGVD